MEISLFSQNTFSSIVFHGRNKLGFFLSYFFLHGFRNVEEKKRLQKLKEFLSIIAAVCDFISRGEVENEIMIKCCGRFSYLLLAYTHFGIYSLSCSHDSTVVLVVTEIGFSCFHECFLKLAKSMSKWTKIIRRRLWVTSEYRGARFLCAVSKWVKMERSHSAHEVDSLIWSSRSL